MHDYAVLAIRALRLQRAPNCRRSKETSPHHPARQYMPSAARINQISYALAFGHSGFGWHAPAREAAV